MNKLNQFEDVIIVCKSWTFSPPLDHVMRAQHADLKKALAKQWAKLAELKKKKKAAQAAQPKPKL